MPWELPWIGIPSSPKAGHPLLVLSGVSGSSCACRTAETPAVTGFRPNVRLGRVLWQNLLPEPLFTYFNLYKKDPDKPDKPDRAIAYADCSCPAQEPGAGQVGQLPTNHTTFSLATSGSRQVPLGVRAAQPDASAWRDIGVALINQSSKPSC